MMTNASFLNATKMTKDLQVETNTPGKLLSFTMKQKIWAKKTVQRIHQQTTIQVENPTNCTGVLPFFFFIYFPLSVQHK